MPEPAQRAALVLFSGGQDSTVCLASALTRFDRGHLTLESSQHINVDVIARQVFRVTFETTRSEGNGGLPAGVTLTADSAATQRDSEAQLAASRAAVPTRLATWAAEHGETPTARPTVADCFSPLPPVGHVETCQPCQGAGKIECTLCHAAGTLTWADAGKRSLIGSAEATTWPRLPNCPVPS